MSHLCRRRTCYQNSRESSPGAVPRFLHRFKEAYRSLGNAETVVSAAAVHHRLIWNYAFIDGNGRVARLMSYAMLQDAMDTGSLYPKSTSILKAILFRGKLPRADVSTIVGTTARQARRIVSKLLDAEVITSESPRTPLRIAFPARLAGRWMPGLFPE